jgi:uncharacterized protein (TIGR04141 family)
MKKNKISIYLFKDGFNGDTIIKSGIEKVSIPNLGTAYVFQSRDRTPAWVSFFSCKELLDKIGTVNCYGAVLLVSIKVNGRQDDVTFGLSFGRGYTLIKDDTYVERFGLKTVLNSISEDSLRQIRRDSVGKNQAIATEQLPRPGKIDMFDFDVDTDLVKSVAGKANDDLLSGMITGGDAISVTLPISSDGIKDFLVKLYDRYSSSRYKDHFDWVDSIEDVKSKTICAELEKLAIEEANNGSDSIWMAVPEEISWESISKFSCGDIDMGDDISLPLILKNHGPFKDYAELSSLSIKAIDASDGKTVSKEWGASHCLFGEVTYEGGIYCINCGKWYKVDENFKEAVDKYYSDADVSGINFNINGKTSSEDAFNKKFVDANKNDFVLMDKKLISCDNRNGKIELCDILGRNNTFIHVKNYSSSATLSHLFMQGLVSAESISSDKTLLDKANLEIEKNDANNSGIRIAGDQDMTVVYTILSNATNGAKPNIPFFSKVSFRSVARQLRMMGKKVEIACARKN